MAKNFPCMKTCVVCALTTLLALYWLQDVLIPSKTLPSFINASAVLASQEPDILANWSLPKPIWKRILLYNHPHPLITVYFGSTGNKPFVQHNCSVSACELFTQQTASMPMEKFDALLIHVFALREAGFNSWPHARRHYKRSPHQYYIFFTQEPPTLLRHFGSSLSSYNNYFNWTMTYKQDSDVVLDYGYVESVSNATFTATSTNLTTTFDEPSLRLLNSKKKLVAWFVSDLNTPGKRELYARDLEKYIPVHIFGKGGNLTCPRQKGFSISQSTCYAMLERNYKFYLSFENSLCEDYVTEKLFLVFERLVVPIVYGKADYASFLPQHSYINALDYTPQALSAYLKYLDSNDTAYREYFWWKPYYKVHAGWADMSPRAMCQLCAKLHEEPHTTKIYNDITQFYGNQSNCVAS